MVFEQLQVDYTGLVDYFSDASSLLSSAHYSISFLGSNVVDGLMQVLWGILDLEQPDTQTMNNIVISSVELIYCYAECLALHGKGYGEGSVAPAVVLMKQLLFCPSQAIQTASRCVIIPCSSPSYNEFLFKAFGLTNFMFPAWLFLQDYSRFHFQDKPC